MATIVIQKNPIKKSFIKYGYKFEQVKNYKGHVFLYSASDYDKDTDTTGDISHYEVFIAHLDKDVGAIYPSSGKFGGSAKCVSIKANALKWYDDFVESVNNKKP